MIKHIVMYKLKDVSKVDNVVDMLNSMKGKVPQIISMEVGKDIIHSERSYDVILSVVFESVEKMNEYRVFPYHKETVMPYLHSQFSSSVSVDFEI